MAAVTAWMAIWWFTEATHLAVTSLLPIVLFPLLGILDSKTTATQYMDPIIFLFIGGFMIAFAIERWELHKRFALKILTIVGTSPSRILFGVMLTSYLISMWISNTATVMMLISAVLAIVYQIEKYFTHEHQAKQAATALLIGLAYSSTIGGMATLVGTPTNMIFYREYSTHFTNNDLNFFSWFAIAFPISLAFLFIAYWVLKKMFIHKSTVLTIEKDYFKKTYNQLGKMSFEEKAVASIFCSTAILWFTRADIDFGIIQINGWNNLFPNKEFISDSTVAIFMAVLLFMIPSKTEKGNSLLMWDDAKKLPFDIILLFGGGFALAKGFDESGLSKWLALQLHFTEGTHILLIIFLLCALIVLISEFASNVACIQLMLPILIALLPILKVHPLVLLIPATLASSLGFMLPVATAPNTIVFGSNKIRVKDMLKAGFVLDVVGIILITIAMYFFL
jgi:sodium-dependent dicarboxylate transporter 2/3/5